MPSTLSLSPAWCLPRSLLSLHSLGLTLECFHCYSNPFSGVLLINYKYHFVITGKLEDSLLADYVYSIVDDIGLKIISEIDIVLVSQLQVTSVLFAKLSNGLIQCSLLHCLLLYSPFQLQSYW